jgi:anti-sigma factor ChrR (cupin superfamily)
VGEQHVIENEHVIELLDAYALGALEEAETSSVEAHVAECVECWNEMTTAQETAGLLSLSVAMHEAPARLGERIISTAQRETSPVPVEGRRGFWARFSRPMAVGAMGVASVAVIAVGLSMQEQVDDLEAENSTLNSQLRASTFALEQQLAETDAKLEEQEILLAVSSDENTQELVVAPTRRGVEGTANYSYSEDDRQGVVECIGLEPLPPGMLYQVWVESAEGTYPMATFLPVDGECLVTMSLGYLKSPPTAIGITTETIPGGVEEPSTPWVLYTEIPQG